MKKNKVAKIVLVIIIGAVTYYTSFNYTKNMKETMLKGNDRSQIKTDRKLKNFPASSYQKLKKPQIKKEYSKKEPVRAPANQAPTANLVEIENFEDEHWQEDLVDSLQNSVPDAEVKIHHVKNHTKRMKNKTFVLKSVVVELKHPTQGTSTYRALVDPSTGAIIKTWDKSRFEDFTGRNRFQMTYQGN